MGKFKIAVIIAIALVIFIAFMDSKGFEFWQNLSGFDGEAYEKGSEAYLNFFWTFAYGLIAFTALAYYFLAKRDLSETLAIFLIAFLLISFGISDILYYSFIGQPVDNELPWLDNHWIIGSIGGGNVTKESLYTSALIGILVTWITITWLKKQNSFLGVKI